MATMICPDCGCIYVLDEKISACPKCGRPCNS